MTLASVLNSDVGFTLATSLVGGVWTLLRSSEWYRQAKRDRYQEALAALEAGVEQTYQTYVRAIKESRADGRLTDEEMRAARERARDAAVVFGRTQGLDVLKELGPQYVDVLISKLVKGLKRS